MPEQKGRKRRGRDRRRDAAPAAATPPQPAPKKQQELPEGVRLPSPTARITGLIISVVTVFIAGLMISDALSGDNSTAEATLRIVVAVFLLALSIAVAALCIATLWVRELVVRRWKGAA
jgi:hypothetical protein